MKKLISVLLVTLMLLSSVTVVMAKLPKETLELVGATVEKDGFTPAAWAKLPEGSDYDRFGCYGNFSEGSFPKKPNYALETLGTLTTGKATCYFQVPIRTNNAIDPAQYDPVTVEEHLDGGSLEDYILEVSFSSRSGTADIKDIEIGLGNYKAGEKEASVFDTRPAVVKTIPIAGLGFTNSDFKAIVLYKNAETAYDTITLSVPVKDILEKGNEKKFPYNNNQPNELSADNVNLFAVKATQTKDGATYPMIFTSIKFVKKSTLEKNSLELIGATYANDGFAISSGGAALPADDDSIRFERASIGKLGFADRALGTVKDTEEVKTGYWGQPIRVQNASNSSNYDPTTIEEHLDGGSLEDYMLEVSFLVYGVADDIKDIEIGLGNYKANTSAANAFGTRPSVIKTIPLADLGFTNADFYSMTSYRTSATDYDIVTLTVPVKYILEKGTTKEFPYNGTAPNELSADNVNLFAVKATQTLTKAATVGYPLVFKSIRLVKKNAEIFVNNTDDTVNFSVLDYTSGASASSSKALLAYYKEDDNGNNTLIDCDVVSLNKTSEGASDNEAVVSITPDNDKASEATKIKAFLFDSMDNITPLTKAVSVLFE